MDHILHRLLERPELETARLAGSAVRREMRQDPRRALSGLSSWSAHPNPWVRIASGVGYAHYATVDRESLASVLPFLERLASDLEEDVRRHGAQAAIEQLWLAHPDAMESVTEEWVRKRNDAARVAVLRAVASLAAGSQIRRPSVLRRFIERGLALADLAAPDATPELRAVLAETVNDLACVAPELVAPMLRDWARREDVGCLRLVALLARLPAARKCEGVDFAHAAARLREHQTRQRIDAVRRVRAGVGKVEYPQVVAKRLLVPQDDPQRPWAHAADPYRGCQLRCEFCNSRSLSEWVGEDRESFVRRVTVVRNAPELLAAELREDSRLPRDVNVLGIGVLSDPYQPAEEGYAVVRELLKECLELGHPAVIQTREPLVLRDLDLLEAMAEQGLVNVLLSIQSPVEGVRNKIEVGTATVAERYRVIGMLARKEVPVGVVVSPVMPELTDDPEILDETFRRAAEAGADWAVVEPLNLRGSAGVKVRLFLEDLVPTLVPRYDELYGSSERGTEPDPAWTRRLVTETAPELRARHGLDDVSRMITCGRDPQALLARL